MVKGEGWWGGNCGFLISDFEISRRQRAQLAFHCLLLTPHRLLFSTYRSPFTIDEMLLPLPNGVNKSDVDHSSH